VYKLRYSKRFKKDFKRISRNPNFSVEKLGKILNLLVKKGRLGAEYGNHKLRGEFQDCHECHIEFNLLLIYKANKEMKLVSLLRIGSHSDLF